LPSQLYLKKIGYARYAVTVERIIEMFVIVKGTGIFKRFFTDTDIVTLYEALKFSHVKAELMYTRSNIMGIYALIYYVLKDDFEDFNNAVIVVLFDATLEVMKPEA
jgi:hypothetical protein